MFENITAACVGPHTVLDLLPEEEIVFRQLVLDSLGIKEIQVREKNPGNEVGERRL